MGGKQSTEDEISEDFEIFRECPSNYKDAVELVSQYLGTVTNNTNDGKSQTYNRTEMVLAHLLAKGVNFLSFIEHSEEDKLLNEKINSLWWITPEDLELKLDLKNTTSAESFSRAIYEIANMTTKANPFDMMHSLVDACNFATCALQNEGAGTDDMLPCLIFAILKSNPPKLYSCLKFVKRFRDRNENIIKSGSSHIVPKIVDGIMDCCFTNIFCAVNVIDNMAADENSKTIIYDGESQLHWDVEKEYTEKLTKQMEKEVKEAFTELEEKLKTLIKIRMRICDQHREDMLQIADVLDGQKKNLNIARVVSYFHCIAGGIVSIVGFGLMFTTFGVSAIMIPVGAGIAGAGGLAAGIGGFVEYGINKKTAIKIKGLREAYENQIKEVFESLKRIEYSVESVACLLDLAGNTTKSIFGVVDVVMKLVRVAVVVDNVADVGVTAFRAASTAGRGIAIAGVVLSAVMLPIDMIFFGISLKKLATGEKSKQAIAIRSWLDAKLPNEKQIADIVSKLQTVTLEYLQEIRHPVDINKQGIEEAEEKLKNALEEMKKVIDGELNEED